MSFTLTSFLFVTLLCTDFLSAQQDIAGTWAMKTRDGAEIALVEVSHAGGEYRARVISFGPASRTRTCANCPGENRGRSLKDMDLFWGLRPVGDHYDGGSILDPESGKVYSLVVYPKGALLEVRGYLVMHMFGKSQFWHRAEKLN